ncbi:follistatin-like isoform X2 [Portunus trituberculatus]|uniref:follistatin-like isoform X2 n=1 Tax=Portunus trituberculatus TaxID=210409 RepID=UPI001E1CEDE5|nr:follistatin-like isoform X2 [Portunus trituberculatus]XP_045116967.1 follistatin-like isoform X2 [Portunus trituberculatus]
MSRESCCSDPFRRGWSPTPPAAASYTTHATHARAAAFRSLNATPVVTVDVSGSAGTCSPCTTTCAGVQCGEDRKCVVRCGTPMCVCSPQCHLKHKESVCGSDNRTYKSECHLLKRACRKKKRLLVAHYGPCQTCIGVRCGGSKKCVMDEQMNPRCLSCPESCPLSQRRRHLCGTDQRTYSSPCHLKQASCLAGAVILRAYKGPCQEDATCNTVRCWRGQKCLLQEHTGQPQCTACGSLDSCLPSSRPVCASDGKVYPSWCAFRHEACRSGRALTPTLHLHCAAIDGDVTEVFKWYRGHDHTKPDDCHKQPFKLKKNKQRRKQLELMKQNEIRQQIRRQRVLQGVAQVAGSTMHELSLGERLNSVERGAGRGGAVVERIGSRKVTSIDGDSSNDKRKKRKRRRRRRNCKKNRKRARQERLRSREQKEGD